MQSNSFSPISELHLDQLACILLFRHIYGDDAVLKKINRNEEVGFTWIEGVVAHTEDEKDEMVELLVSDDGGMFRRMSGAIYGISDIFSTVDLVRRLGYSTTIEERVADEPGEVAYKQDRDILKWKIEQVLENIAYAEYDINPLAYQPLDVDLMHLIQKDVTEDLKAIKGFALEIRNLLLRYPSSFKPVSALYLNRQASEMLLKCAFGQGARLDDMQRYEETSMTLFTGYVVTTQAHCSLLVEDAGRLIKSADFPIPHDENPFILVKSLLSFGYAPF